MDEIENVGLYYNIVCNSIHMQEESELWRNQHKPSRMNQGGKELAMAEREKEREREGEREREVDLSQLRTTGCCWI